MSKSIETINELVFPQDTAERKQWFKSASFAHPAKMHLSLQFYLIEHYTKKGDIILDPMAGSGTVLVACALERNVICVELEQKFVDMQKANWEKIKALGPMLGFTMGEAIILRGDARNLMDFSFGFLHRHKADCAIFSPPYAEAQTGGGIAQKGYQGPKHTPTDLVGKRSYMPEQAGSSDGQIVNLTYDKKVDIICTSPPYEGSLETSSRNTKGGISARDPKLAQTGTYADLDPSIKRLREHGRTDDKAGGPYGRSLGHPYSGATENIGNLKSESYLQAMLLVYQNCFRILKAEGLIILVVKNFIRDKKIVHLDTDTIKLCKQAGFALIERLKRKLTQQSFWRRIYQQKYPDAPKIEFEDVLIFAKARTGL